MGGVLACFNPWWLNLILAVANWDLRQQTGSVLVESMVIAAVFVTWLVAAWAMLRMVIAALKDRERRSLGWLLGGSFILASYNRKHLRIFAACVLAAVGLVILLNVLFLTGKVKL